MKTSLVTVLRESVLLPTYLPSAPDRNPMFLETRVYQGSSGQVYPLPFYDRIAEKAVPHAWEAIYLENEFLRVMILSQLGGRIHRLQDKTNGYDLIYYQPVIKPALVGLAGPWISGGIEFNWPQHHRPSTFMPTDVQIERHADGAVTVWLGEHDPMARMKGMHGVCLHPGRAVLELKARVYNRTSETQTFLWWANVATRVHEYYQSFFPPDTTFVADHAKRAMSTFPRCSGRYYGVDYGARGKFGVPASEAPSKYVPPHCREKNRDSKTPPPPVTYEPDDLSWYANIPVPTSYMCMGSKEDFFGGYDHRERAGLVHIADHHISPGKKQWTWGNHEFGYAWDRNLTDTDGAEHRPYIELMAGVFTDNQPDFSFLQPGETKSWSQFWYPIRQIGPAHRANIHAAVNLQLTKNTARIGIAVTREQRGLRVQLLGGAQVLAKFTQDAGPAAPFVTKVVVPRGTRLEALTLEVRAANGDQLITYRPTPAKPPAPEQLAKLAATEPPAPTDVASSDELYLTGLHLDQYRHATRGSADYWREALRRDPGDCRSHLALGRWHLRRGELLKAEEHLRMSIRRLTRRNPNPADGEAYYQLGRCLCHLGREDEAYEAFHKATWNQAWQAAASHALANIDCRRRDWARALDSLDRSIKLNADNLCARALRALVLRQLGQASQAMEQLRANLTIDPLDHAARNLLGERLACDTQTRLDLALDYSRAGFHKLAIEVLADARPELNSGTAPLLSYYRAWLCRLLGDAASSRRHLATAAKADPSHCFPARLEEEAILAHAIATNPRDALAHTLMGHWLYHRRRHREAIEQWESATRLNSNDAVAWRCLGIAYFNILKDARRARRSYAAARLANPDDARLLFEADQLAKRMGDSPNRRLRALEKDSDLVLRRDDLVVELCTLHNQLGQSKRAAKLLAARRFQPWEGGEGQALSQHVRTHLLLGQAALADGKTSRAHREFEAALSAPENLGEAKHLLANQSDVHFWLGEARAGAGNISAAKEAWLRAATFKGDFQLMSIRTFSEMTYYSALAWRKLGKKVKAERLLRELLKYARQLDQTPASIDYFATSLPTLLLFADDIGERQAATAKFLEAQARLGLGQRKRALHLLKTVLKTDPNHALAADLLAGLSLRTSRH